MCPLIAQCVKKEADVSDKPSKDRCAMEDNPFTTLPSLKRVVQILDFVCK